MGDRVAQIEQWIESVFPSRKGAKRGCALDPGGQGAASGGTVAVFTRETCHMFVVAALFLGSVALFMVYIAYLFGARWNLAQGKYVASVSWGSLGLVYNLVGSLKSNFSGIVPFGKTEL